MWQAAAIQGGSDLFGSIINNVWGQANQAGQREHSYQMTDYLYQKDLEQWNRQNEWNLQQWNRQNEYNSPSMQMQRFREAGLNPNLIYSQGQPGQAASVTSGSFQAKGSNANNFQPKFSMPDMISMYQDWRLKQAQIDQVDSVTAKNYQEIKIKKILEDIKGLDLGFLPLKQAFEADSYDQTRKGWGYDLQAKEYGVQKIIADIEKALADTNLSNTQREKLNEWLYEWRKNGINLDRDSAPWRWGQKAGNWIYDWWKNNIGFGGQNHNAWPSNEPY